MPGFHWKHHEAGNLSAATAVLFLCIQGWEAVVLACLQPGEAEAQLGRQNMVLCAWPEASRVTWTKCPFTFPTLGHSRKSVQVNERKAAQAEASLNLQHSC